MGDRRVDPYRKSVQTGQLVGLVTGTPYQLPNLAGERVVLRPHPDNSGNIWVGFATGAAVGSDTGYPITWTDTDSLTLEGLANLSVLWANFDTADDRLCWIMLYDAPAGLGP